MKTINRRDYLKHMGIGAGAIVGAAKLDAFAQGEKPRPKSRPSKKQSLGSNEKETKSDSLLLWQKPWPTDFSIAPSKFVVKLIFWGLMGFSYKKQGNKIACDVGFHNRGDSTHHHRLFIFAYDNAFGSGPCHTVLEPPESGDQGIKKLSIAAEKPTDFQEAYFYQPGNPGNRNELTDSKDFRWVIDFESAYMYGSALPQGTSSLVQRKEVYRPTLTVPHGLFYTMRKTNSTFRVQPADGSYVTDLGNVADVIGANIYVEEGTAVNLVVNGKTYPVRAPGEIYFINYCYKDGDMTLDCEAQPHNIKDKTKRSDFYLQYKAFKLPNGRPEYELFLLEGGDSSEVPGLVCPGSDARHKMSIRDIFGHPFTDEAPCAGSGYGGGGGLPPYP